MAQVARSQPFASGGAGHDRRLPGDRRPRTDRRPADVRARRHATGRSTGSAAPGSTRPACSRRCSTTRRAGSSASRRHATEYATKQLYFPDTAVLITRFMSAEGVAEIHDFMPIDQPWQPTDRHSIVRMVRVPRGEVTLRRSRSHRASTTARGAHAADDRARRRLRERQGVTHAALVGRRSRTRDNDVVGTITLRPVTSAGSSSNRRRTPHRARSPPTSSTTRSSETVQAWRELALAARRIAAAGATW